MNEYIDIFNDKYEYLGTSTKKEAHAKGEWHRVFTCIIVDPQDETIVLQKKTPNRYNFERPDYLDISVGGHYKAGEAIEDGVREIKEELGIEVSYDKLVPLGIRQTVVTLASNYINKEFQHIHLLEYKAPLDSYQLSGDEVSGVVKVPVSQGIDLLTGKINNIEAKGIFFLNNKEIEKKLNLSIEDFVPNYLKTDQIFLRLFIAAEKYFKKNYESNLFW
ncbi:NUDIX domain-containing protein [Gracilibacillus marinus]|jgi:isopentenyldiphosphate isomerase|uniref:NUDIX domain-containing protein n=1 Tax=Gracilibacillus marinus TaxID=630535 RepID=A0ABV8VX16_9BACI